MKIYLMRHGQTTGDIEDRYGGEYDDDLTAEGFKQAENLAQELKDQEIEILFTSPKKRALQTTECLKTVLSHVQVEVWDDLRERNRYGILSGMTKQEAREKYPELVKLAEDASNTIEGAESYDQLVMRGKAMMNIILDTTYETVGVVTHGGIIRMILKEMLTTDAKKVGDCGYAVLNYENYDLSIISLNRIIL